MGQPASKYTETGSRYYKLANRDIVYLKSILEAYEGLNTMSTIDGKRGLIRVSFPLCFAGDVEALMQEIAKEIEIAEVNEEGEPCSKP
ncbi:DUF4911 domain-containing protein [Citrifermentans bremense]|uniref:DUF4911 domain-containing protein n=1 Tax=Citrifermentans bremense TaxID=60035 RepID=UPI0004255516|nr:DUF4911 domain-containing protein [Citrifermentans bremense]